jgi:hypothetical protein
VFFPIPLFFEFNFMSQSTLQNGTPGGSPLKSRLVSLSVAALRASQGWLQALDQILRGEITRPSALREQSLRIPMAGLALLILALALLYGFCMGMYPGCRIDDPSWQRWLACTLKIPALFFLTLCVTFPSLYVVNALVGSRLHLLAVLQLLIAALAVNLAVLASAGPIVAFFSFSTTNCPFMVLLNVLVFAISGLLGMSFLLQTLHRMSTLPRNVLQVPRKIPESERPGRGVGTAGSADQPSVGARRGPQGAPGGEGASGGPSEAVPPQPSWSQTAWSEPGWLTDSLVPRKEELSALDALEGHVLGRHVKTVFCCWTVIFSVVGAQMAWVLRPYFGNPGEPFVWFGPRTSNFFEGVWMALQKLLS